MTATTITIGPDSYPSYATLAEAETYLRPETAWTDSWDAWSDEQKGSALVRAARFLTALEYNADPSAASGDFAQALEDANARLAAFYAAQPTAEDGSIVVSRSGRIASISAGQVSISYSPDQAKPGETQLATSDDELAAIRLGIPEVGAYDLLKGFLLHPADTLAAGYSAPWRSAPVVRYGTTKLTQQLGLSPNDPRYDRLSQPGAWPPGGTVLP